MILQFFLVLFKEKKYGDGECFLGFVLLFLELGVYSFVLFLANFLCFSLDFYCFEFIYLLLHWLNFFAGKRAT